MRTGTGRPAPVCDCMGRSGHPLDDARERVCTPPLGEGVVGAHAVAQHGHVVFDAGDLHVVGRVVFELQDGAPRHGCQRGGDPVCHTFEITVVARTPHDVDHVELPLVAVAIAVRRVPFDARLVGCEQVAALDATHGRIGCQLRHCREALFHAQRRRIDVEVDVAVLHQQARPQRSDLSHLGTDRPPYLREPRVADDLFRPQPVAAGDPFDGIHNVSG